MGFRVSLLEVYAKPLISMVSSKIPVIPAYPRGIKGLPEPLDRVKEKGYFCKDSDTWRMAATAKEESPIARACGYGYNFVIGEAELADEARTKLGSLVDEIKVDPPNCLQPWNENYPKR